MAAGVPRPADFLDSIALAFSDRLARHGATPKGVLWNDAHGQQLRFELLAAVMGEDIHKEGASINDLGCGYGALFDFLKEFPALGGGRYFGYDICADMVAAARNRVADPRAAFFHGSRVAGRADYSFVSGTFNMKLAAGAETWNRFVKQSLADLWDKTAKGLAFNMLDISGGKLDHWLYFADRGDFLNFCARAMSPKVSLLDSAPLNEWTLLVRRE